MNPETKVNSLRIFTIQEIDKLYRELENTFQIDKYINCEIEQSEFEYARGTLPFSLSSDILDSTKSDSDNAINLYTSIKLNETEASDIRLWATLSHTVFYQYMSNRWTIKPYDADSINKTASRIRNRYFVKTLSLSNLMRNGISRLWWAAHLTFDAGKNDPFEDTKLVFSKEDILVNLFERELGCCKNVRDAALNFLKNHEEIRSIEDNWRAMFRHLNLIGGTKLLPLIQISEITEFLSNQTYPVPIKKQPFATY
jgi:hypothetical protein